MGTKDKSLILLSLRAQLKLCKEEYEIHQQIGRLHAASPEAARQHFELYDYWWNKYLETERQIKDLEKGKTINHMKGDN